jgi:hypothetical protein
MCYAVVMGFMFALSDLPEVTVAIAQPLVPALALGMSALLGMEILSFVSLGGIFMSIAGMLPGSRAHGASFLLSSKNRFASAENESIHS